jgi:2-keto-4-pentenoate hydratase/2-oxohepta-3-ene-1,7-dioic acid hydratase in catechol pathway
VTTSPFIPTLNAKPFPHALGKIVCVGRNYAAHAVELNNPVGATPLLFIKPATCAVPLQQPLALPADRGAVHHEVELALLIGAPLRNATTEQAAQAVIGIGIALDLTLRDVQEQLKKDGHPWERAKAFDGAYPVSVFVSPGTLDLQNLTVQLWRNEHLQQDGNTGQMLFPIVPLLMEISRSFTLLPGDIVSTGTPAGVGPLLSGDQLIAVLADTAGATELLHVATRVG